MLRKILFRLTRNRVARRIDLDGERYMERYLLGRGLGVTAYLHRFVAGDGDRSVHDHPWAWSMSVVLAGGYREERLQMLDVKQGWISRFRNLRAGSVNLLRATSFHRITAPEPETWTLFLHTPKVREWGFLQRFRQDNGLYSVEYVAHAHGEESRWLERGMRGYQIGRAEMEAGESA